MRRSGGADESRSEVLVDEVAKGLELERGKGIDGSKWGRRPFLKFNLEVVRPVRRKLMSFLLTEDVGIIMIVSRNVGEVNRSVGSLSSACPNFWLEV